MPPSRTPPVSSSESPALPHPLLAVMPGKRGPHSVRKGFGTLGLWDLGAAERQEAELSHVLAHVAELVVPTNQVHLTLRSVCKPRLV